MKKESTIIRDDDLHAYVDGLLSEEKIRAVEALMSKDHSVAKRVKEWQQQNRMIQDHFDAINFNDTFKQFDLEEIEKKQKKTIVQGNTQGRRWYYSMAASLALIIVSGSAGWFAHGLSQTTQNNVKSFVKSAVSAHQVFSVEVVHPVEVGADEQHHLLAWLSKRIDHQLSLPNLQAHGYKLLGGRLLPMKEGRAAAQFMFEDINGRRITWLVSKKDTYKDRALLFDNEAGVNSFSWMDSTVANSVSGEVSRDELHQITKDLYEQINKKSTKKIAALSR